MSQIDEYLGKKYSLKSSENFDDYLKFVGIGYISRIAATSAHPVSSLTKNDDGTYTFTMATTFRNVILSFRLDEEFIETRADGTKVKAKVYAEGNKLIHEQTEDSGRKSKHVREFTPDTLTVITTVDGWDDKCVRVYEIMK